MKCPYCNKELKDDASFCGFCGKQIPQMPSGNASSDPPKPIEQTPKKKRTALKFVLILVLFAFISGSVLGFLTARDIVSFKSLMPNNRFKWTNASEGQSETTEPDNSTEDKESRNLTSNTQCWICPSCLYRFCSIVSCRGPASFSISSLSYSTRTEVFLSTTSVGSDSGVQGGQAGIPG